MSINRDLYTAFEQRNLGKFQEALEVFQADPNYAVKEKDKTIFELILETPDSAKFIKLCVDNGADFYMKNNNEQFPLHGVIASRCLENLKQVEMLFNDVNLEDTEPAAHTKRYSPYANVKMDHGSNSLHMLAEALTNENHDQIFEMIKILIKHGCNANFPNYDGKTAFHIILEQLPKLKQRKEILDYFLKRADVDLFTHRSEEIIEMVMNQKLKFDMPEKEEVSIDFESMIALLRSTQVNKFETLLPFFKASCDDSEAYADCCAMFLECAVRHSFINIVDLLIDYGVDVNRVSTSTKSKIPPAFLACGNADPGILRLFLLHPKIKLSYDNEGTRKSLLHQFFDDFKAQSYTFFRRMASREMSPNQKKCFDLLIAHPKCNRHLINAHDEVGLPAIYYSVRYKSDYITMQLLKNGAYVGTVVNGIRKSLLEEFLNSTITTNHRFDDDEDMEIRIDYSFLTPPCKDTFTKKRVKKQAKAKPPSQETSIEIPAQPKSPEHVKILPCDSLEQYAEEIKPLKKIAESAELQHFLAHPTIASFILLKWNKLSFLVYINLFMILLFMVSMFPFIVLCQVVPHSEQSTSISFIFFRVLSFIALSAIIVRECTQCVISFRQYVSKLSNWVDISLMISSLIILVFETQIPNHVSRLLRTLIILIATLEYFNILGMVPILSISIHTKMFKKVCVTFLKSLTFYSMMIIAFAFSFYSLQGDKFSKDIVKYSHPVPPSNPDVIQDVPVTNATRNERFNNFYTIGSAIIKSFVMLTGELETSYVHTEGVTYAALFLLFLFLVTIVLYNLLNALAVSDTQEIKRDAKLIDLHQRIETMHQSEEAIFRRKSKIGNWLKTVISMFPKTLPEGNIMIKPNRSYRIFIRQNDAIILNDWLHNRLKFLKPEVKFNTDIMKEIQLLLVTKREEQQITAVRKLKESRNEKLANDVLKISELISSIQINVTKLQADLYSLSRRANL